MSDSAPTGVGNADAAKMDRRQSLTKYLSKAKTVLKRDKKRQSVDLGAAPVETPSSSPALSKQTETVKAKPTTSATAAGTNLSQDAYNRGMIQQERVRALFEKYGFSFEPSEMQLTTTQPAERVEKPIRMRVHRQCHRCQTTFGVDRVCVQCSHKRCKKCPRYPVKKTKHGDTPKIAGMGGVPTDTDKKAKSKGKMELTMPSRNGGQDRVRKDIKQRVIRTCHKCETRFISGEKTCASCSHVRCTKCPREPPKFHKYPDGYPGDAQPSDDERELVPMKNRTFKKPRRAVRIFCDSCDTMFLKGTKICSTCNHQRCDDCRRVPPKKVKPPPDPAVVKSLEAKLAALHMGEESTASTA